MKCIKALTTFSVDLPFIASCHNTPVGFKDLDFFQPPNSANISLKRTILLQNIACFRPGNLGNITFAYLQILQLHFLPIRIFLTKKRSCFCSCCCMLCVELTQSSQPSNNFICLPPPTLISQNSILDSLWQWQVFFM